MLTVSENTLQHGNSLSKAIKASSVGAASWQHCAKGNYGQFSVMEGLTGYRAAIMIVAPKKQHQWLQLIKRDDHQ
jgi:hypothetical protein